MDLKKSKDEYIGRLGRRRRKGEIVELYYDLRNEGNNERKSL